MGNTRVFGRFRVKTVHIWCQNPPFCGKIHHFVTSLDASQMSREVGITTLRVGIASSTPSRAIWPGPKEWWKYTNLEVKPPIFGGFRYLFGSGTKERVGASPQGCGNHIWWKTHPFGGCTALLWYGQMGQNVPKWHIFHTKMGKTDQNRDPWHHFRVRDPMGRIKIRLYFTFQHALYQCTRTLVLKGVLKTCTWDQHQMCENTSES